MLIAFLSSLAFIFVRSRYTAATMGKKVGAVMLWSGAYQLTSCGIVIGLLPSPNTSLWQTTAASVAGAVLGATIEFISRKHHE